ncbi:hypothetical protein L2725_12495 [Shewanella corallii]|uniref:Uncharacterized protein n=1 Tax=Shewanella corallii TaxID=560080 RepID=A0ABT0N9S3_9GAMM|nr:hypothetical protein [Shewanella corallii]MCL2914587.1 hypothetical protein [Shewanella corallii]
MDTKLVLRMLCVIFCSFFIIWGYLPTDSGVGFFQTLVSQYARLDTSIESQILSGFIVPAFFVATAWFTTEFVAGQVRGQK